MIAEGHVGPQILTDGSDTEIRLGKAADVIVSELQGRFYESNYRGALFSDGLTLTAINNVTYTTGTLGATVTPIAGVYNPAGSGKNLVILQAQLAVATTALTATGGGPYVWATSLTTAPITTGNNPLNRATLQQTGSVAKGLANVAPTGLTPNLAVRFASALGGGSAYNISFVGTAAGMQTQLQAFVENFDGSLIVPPGGVLALLATTTPVAQSAASGLLWAEVAI